MPGLAFYYKIILKWPEQSSNIVIKNDSETKYTYYMG